MEQAIINQCVELINKVGFPIAAFILMWYSHNKTLKKLIEAINELKLLVKSKK